jgi:hypothetical protein
MYFGYCEVATSVVKPLPRFSKRLRCHLQAAWSARKQRKAQCVKSDDTLPQSRTFRAQKASQKTENNQPLMGSVSVLV